MERKIVFDYMNKNEVCSHVEVYPARQEVIVTDYATDIMDTAFGLRPHDMENLDWFFRSRSFPETRADIKELLAMMNLTEFSAYQMCKRTLGRMISDTYWIRWEGETRTWEELNAFYEKSWQEMEEGKYTIEEFYANNTWREELL